ncbi:LuxR family transcriptional regulator [Burkholderia ubonensis]|uniref:LuxR family transcriptional regulator n=1 Tax=Burkholderia ubonensis TaxID=101571 RepID=A0AB73GCN4_9BURK|nr:response regulator transcription factor [Burkholderia ubonensis]KVK90463.1 LuxR family transcriptional regulator [Burkholderia ubonensis]KVL73349.1 LuxR family transcriptional regulator [Burkholderia ubonensis]KVM35612.1 LuxR family transcriptional regulator [Burkholderia ubonensis]KVM39025.1 LuxR family transcriptional regulator [Burkholderia ubonensis]
MDPFTIQVIVADDHPAIINGLLASLTAHRTVNVVATASNSTELIAALDEHPCDVLVSDYAMPGGEFGDGITLFSFLRRRYPDTRIVVLTMMDNSGVIRSLLKLGIQCILSKSDSTDHVLTAIHGAYASGRYFSPSISEVAWQVDVEAANVTSNALTTREEEVIRLFVSGLSVNQIAEQLKRSKQTISSQKSNAMKKLGIDNDTDLVKYSMGVALAASSGAPGSTPDTLNVPTAGATSRKAARDDKPQ